MSNRHCMMQAGPFEDLSTPSEFSWRPYGNSSNNLGPSSLRCSSKNEAANLNASIQQQQLQEQESNSYNNWEEERTTKKKKLLEKQTLPFGEFSAFSHRPQSHFLPSPPPIGCSPTVQVDQAQWCERGIRSFQVLSRCQTQCCDRGISSFIYCPCVRR